MPVPRKPRAHQLAALTGALAGLLAACSKEEPRAAAPSATHAPAPTAAEKAARTPPVLTWAELDDPRWGLAVASVEQPRSSRGRVAVPAELRQYEDTRRFLALQMADSTGNRYELPADLAELAGLVLRGEVEELPPLTDDYILYQPGPQLMEDPLTHFDVVSGRNVRLVGSLEAWEIEKTLLTAVARGRGPEARRARLTLLTSSEWYDDPGRRERLFQEHADVLRLASDWGGVRYDLDLPADRTRFQMRLLGCARPGLRGVIEEVARGYRREFHRPLAVSSVMRTHRFQRLLMRLNRNATAVDIPPHTTGMAFDVSYKYMPPDEQNYLLRKVAELESAGRVEALRERNNNVHVYAFAGGPPPDLLVASQLARVEEARLRIGAATSRAKTRILSKKKPSPRALRGRGKRSAGPPARKSPAGKARKPAREPAASSAGLADPGPGSELPAGAALPELHPDDEGPPEP